MFEAEHDGTIAGFLALQGSYVDRLYVDPSRQRRGIGRALITRAVFSISPPPESAPDVEYHWRP